MNEGTIEETAKQEKEPEKKCPDKPINKSEELYKASLTAFFTNELEADKTILGLSVAAIGFFMALFLNKDLQITDMMFVTITLALVTFLITSAMVLMIFHYNKKLILEIIATTGESGNEPEILIFLDAWKYFPFIMGIIFSIIFTLLLIFGKVSHKGESMSVHPLEKHDDVQQAFSGIYISNSCVGGGENYQKSDINQPKQKKEISKREIAKTSKECENIEKCTQKGEINESK